MWCLSKPNGSRSFYPTEEEANAAAGNDRAVVVWFDSFDYEQHDPAGNAAWYAQRAADERARGLAYVTQLLDGLRARWIDPWGPLPEEA